MDNDMRQSLGLVLIGIALLAVGFVIAQLMDDNTAKALGGVPLLAGGVCALIGVLRIAFALIRPGAR